jgi:hypothetical protein
LHPHPSRGLGSAIPISLEHQIIFSIQTSKTIHLQQIPPLNVREKNADTGRHLLVIDVIDKLDPSSTRLARNLIPLILNKFAPEIRGLNR